MSLKDHFDEENLHHAYLLEGRADEIKPELFKLLEEFHIETSGNSDFFDLSFDSIKMQDAMYLKTFGDQKSINGGKKIFIISANTILQEAQNTLLKFFEEPIAETHFFMMLPDLNVLIPTFLSRFYIVSQNIGDGIGQAEVEKFINMNKSSRIEFLKELLNDEEDIVDEDEEEELVTSSKAARAQVFLNTLERVLHEKVFRNNDDKKNYIGLDFLDQILTARKYLRQPGSSVKSLMESLALSIPEKI